MKLTCCVRLGRSGASCFYCEDDALPDVREYIQVAEFVTITNDIVFLRRTESQSIRSLSGMSSASLVVTNILLERFIAGLIETRRRTLFLVREVLLVREKLTLLSILLPRSATRTRCSSALP
jgi:hypothetical protein